MQEVVERVGETTAEASGVGFMRLPISQPRMITERCAQHTKIIGTVDQQTKTISTPNAAKLQLG
ncbi:hypothetical protein [Burkholderia sp. S171]|uniref:hypothetical protein n=1 Tax=Burkholderia sp. S171 TaxID=1641860 RepID=UPI00131E3CBB|nr:hypothetical protein [Burkholderia sp. S171]